MCLCGQSSPANRENMKRGMKEIPKLTEKAKVARDMAVNGFTSANSFP